MQSQPTKQSQRQSLLTALTTAALIATSTSTANAQTQTLYVDDDAPIGGDGTTWNSAFRELQDALDIANQTLTGTVEIRIAQGTYIPPNRIPGAREFRIDPPSILSASAFRLPHDHDLTNLPRLPIATHASRDTPQLTSGVTIKLEGGYAGITAIDPDERGAAFVSVVSGDVLGNDNGTVASRTDNLRSLLRAKMPHNSALLIDGLQFRAVGNAGFSVGLRVQADTGARPSITLRNSRFSDFSATGFDGGYGVWIEPSNPTVFGCTFEDMTFSAYPYGESSTAALAVGPFQSASYWDRAIIDTCIFRRIQGGDTGAFVIYPRAGSAYVSTCLFEHNTAEKGAAMATIFGAGTTSPIWVEFSTFISNTARFGGAVYGTVYATSCNFRLNTAEFGGAGHFVQGRATNSVFTENSATSKGGALSGTGVDATGCRFSRNTAPSGGACALNQGSFDDCEFNDNIAISTGGALAGSFTYALNSRFNRNRASQGGAIWSDCPCSIILGVTKFDSNQARFNGGAIAAPNTGLDIYRSTFSANSVHNTEPGSATQAFGGAIDAQTATINSSRFFGNTARSDLSDAVGGALVATTLSAKSVLFSGNMAVGATSAVGGAIACSDTTLINVTLSRNAAECALAQPFAGGVATYGPALIRSSILWNNTVNGAAGTLLSDAVPFLPFFPITYRFNNITGLPTAFDGLANSGANPLFADADGPDNIVGTPDDNLSLAGINSPCIDASDPADVNSLNLDANEKPRSVNTPVVSPPSGPDVFTDRGAIEYQGNLACGQYSSNNDGDVDSEDLAALLSRFGRTQFPGAWPDFNFDGIVNTKDLVRLLSVFGCSRWS
jgi:predicted outer membrane repeat protein